MLQRLSDHVPTLGEIHQGLQQGQYLFQNQLSPSIRKAHIPKHILFAWHHLRENIDLIFQEYELQSKQIKLQNNL